jgi:uncharacterized membrane protein YfcA
MRRMGIDASLAVPLLAGAVFGLAGVVKGVVGLGLPTVSMALLALAMPPAQAAAWLVVPSLMTNLWQSRPWARLRPMLRRLAGLQLGIGLGTLGGAWILGAPAGAAASAALGVALLAYAGWGLSGAQLSLPARAERWAGPLAGAVTGFITAATGVFVIPAVPYLQALRLPRDQLVQAMGISFTVSTLALAGGLAANDALGVKDAAWSLLMLLPALLGMQLGQWLRSRLSPRVFRTCMLLSLGGLGLQLVLRAAIG